MVRFISSDLVRHDKPSRWPRQWQIISLKSLIYWYDIQDVIFLFYIPYTDEVNKRRKR